MARWYLSRIVGDGTATNKFRAAVGDNPEVTAYVAQIASRPDGSPRRAWALCHVEATDHDAVAGPDVVALPVLPHDQLLGAASVAGRGRVAGKVREVWGRDPDVSPGRSMRDLLHDIGRHDEPHFDADAFGVR